MFNLFLIMPMFRFFRLPYRDQDEAVWHFFDILRVLGNIREVVDFAETAWLTMPDSRAEDLRKIYEKLIRANVENEKTGKKVRQDVFINLPREETINLCDRLKLITGEYSRFFGGGKTAATAPLPQTNRKHR